MFRYLKVVSLESGISTRHSAMCSSIENKADVAYLVSSAGSQAKHTVHQETKLTASDVVGGHDCTPQGRMEGRLSVETSLCGPSNRTVSIRFPASLNMMCTSLSALSISPLSTLKRTRFISHLLLIPTVTLSPSVSAHRISWPACFHFLCTAQSPFLSDASAAPADT